MRKECYRMKYNPEFHEKHGLPWTTEDLIYLCSMWKVMKKADIALALGRTHGSVLTKASVLKEQELFDYFLKLGKQLLEKEYTA